MNLLALRNEVLGHGFDPIQYGARINQYLNDGYGLIVRRVDYFADDASSSFQTVALTGGYAWPADFGKMRSLFDSDRRLELRVASIRQFDRSGVAYGAPSYYALLGKTVQLYPIPDGAYNLTLRYWRIPAPLLVDTDVPVFDDPWHKLLWKYAVWQCFEADDDPTMGQYWQGQFNSDLSNFTADVRFPNSDAAHQVAGMWDQDDDLSPRLGAGGSGGAVSSGGSDTDNDGDVDGGDATSSGAGDIDGGTA